MDQHVRTEITILFINMNMIVVIIICSDCSYYYISCVIYIYIYINETNNFFKLKRGHIGIVEKAKETGSDTDMPYIGVP